MTLESHSPASGERLGAVEAASADAVRAAAARAAVAQPLWANVPVAARARYIRRAARVALDELDELALLLASETGRPRTEAVLGEILPAVSGLRALADDGPGALADRRLGRPPLLRGGRRAIGVQQPRGVIGVLGGSASPWAEPVLEVAATLLAGNGAVVVPAAPLAGERLHALFLRAGIPEDLLAVAHGEEAAAALPGACSRVVSVAAAPAKGAMLVLDGAPVEQVTAAALWAAFAAGGRHPAAVSRLICVASAADPLVDALGERARRLRVGDPTREEAEVGPLRSHDDLARVDELVAEALAGGAQLVCGGATAVPGLSGAFYAPTVLRRVPADARILREPAPGPVLSVVEASTEAEAIAMVQGATTSSETGEDDGPAAPAAPADGPATGNSPAAPAAAADGQATGNSPAGSTASGGSPAEGPAVSAAAGLAEAGRERRARGTVVSVWARDRPKGERVARTLGAELAWVNEHGVVAPGPALRLARHVTARQVASRPAGLGGARRLPYDAALVRARTAAARLAHGREADRLAVLRRDAAPLARAAIRVAWGLVRR